MTLRWIRPRSVGRAPLPALTGDNHGGATVASLQIPITKAGKKAFVTVNTDTIEAGGDLTDEVFNEIMVQGLKVLLNRGMSKITKESFAGDTEKMNAAVTALRRGLEVAVVTRDIAPRDYDPLRQEQDQIDAANQTFNG